ncbi:hypothetical protein BDQ17DRAFT_1425040 [Cyathus striatus]|nr:hypothetical protein BDQ17DRAFT_1425040 [Cyathus striatus]
MVNSEDNYARDKNIGFSTSRERSSDAHRNNIVPFGLARLSKEMEIEHAESEIDQIDEEIASLKRVIALLRKRRSALKFLSTQEKSLFAPIRKLSQDVLQYLFLVCQWNLEEDGCIPACKSVAFVRTITQVCVHWWSVALSCPALWSRIFIDERGQCEVDNSMVGPFVETCISLSRETPLYLGIWSDPPASVYTDSCIQGIVGTAHRWEVISIGCEELFDDIMTNVLPHVTFSYPKDLRIWRLPRSINLNPSPMLTRLRVSCFADNGFVLSLQAAPSLTHLYTHELEDLQALLGVDFPWVQITHFKSSGNIYLKEELATILGMIPNLTYFKLIGETMMVDCITLPRLRTLVVGTDR